MSGKHTPGPWVWRGKSGSLHVAGTAPYTYGETILAPTYEHDSGVDIEVSEANARLIAAAPELLEALRNIAEGNLGDEPWQANYERIKAVAAAAIAKAEGRS